MVYSTEVFLINVHLLFSERQYITYKCWISIHVKVFLTEVGSLTNVIVV